MTDKHDSTINNTITTAFELLDTSIQHGSHNMKVMDSSLNMVISLIEEVRLKEKYVEEAKEEAANSGLDILAKVEALKQEQQRIKKTNDMHAREVYAQKEALANELKELQCRLSGVLDVGDECLEGFDEMCKVLEVRLIKAVTEKELVEKEKLEKEALALKTLAFEESQMLKLVEESERLEQEAVNNSKDLFKEREFVVNNLRVVSDEYPDIRSLRERIDQHVVHPGEFISGSKTPSCFTSSSSSLTRFLTPLHKLENEPSNETNDEHAYKTNLPQNEPLIKIPNSDSEKQEGIKFEPFKFKSEPVASGQTDAGSVAALLTQNHDVKERGAWKRINGREKIIVVKSS